MSSDLKSHLSNKSTWMRLLYMILFVIAFNVAEIVTGVIVVVQILFKLFTGQVNEQLQSFGHKLAIYFRQTVAFLTYDTEDMPYPFAPWPEGATEPARPAAQTTAAPPAPEPEPPAAEPELPAAEPEPPAAEPEPPAAEPEPPAAEPERAAATTKPAARAKPRTSKPKRPRKKPAAEPEA